MEIALERGWNSFLEMLMGEILELATEISLISVDGGTVGSMDGEHAGTRADSILESWIGKTLVDG